MFNGENRAVTTIHEKDDERVPLVDGPDGYGHCHASGTSHPATDFVGQSHLCFCSTYGLTLGESGRAFSRVSTFCNWDRLSKLLIDMRSEK